MFEKFPKPLLFSENIVEFHLPRQTRHRKVEPVKPAVAITALILALAPVSGSAANLVTNSGFDE